MTIALVLRLPIPLFTAAQCRSRVAAIGRVVEKHERGESSFRGALDSEHWPRR
jgi:hypothetical protein